jgi:hypothetical protein
MDIREPDIKKDEILILYDPDFCQENICIVTGCGTGAMMGRSRVKEMMTPIEVGNLSLFGFSRFSKYLVGGDLLFDGGMVRTY